MTSRNNFQQSYAKATHVNLFLLEIMKEKGIDNPLKIFIETWKPWYFEFAKLDINPEDNMLKL